MRTTCLLCQIELEPFARGVQRHPPASDCLVTYTDAWGVALRDEQIKIVETLTDEAEQPLAPIGLFDTHPPVEQVLGEMFRTFGVPRLGGPSSGRGWSSFALYQRCPYAWRKRYVDKARSEFWAESDALAVGTVIHVLLALHYANMIGDYEGLSPQACFEYLRERANPAYVNEGWRVFSAYKLYYQFDDFEPLAIEHDLQDPRTGESTRYDLVMHQRRELPGRLPGTYIVEHKSGSRFDFDFIEGWANDGEVIGEAALWERLGLAKRFGKLRGVIINLLGKQKEPKFHRTIVAPESMLIDAHLDDLRRWEGRIQLSRATNDFPRARNNCIGRYGRCEWFDHCLTGVP